MFALSLWCSAQALRARTDIVFIRQRHATTMRTPQPPDPFGRLFIHGLPAGESRHGSPGPGACARICRVLAFPLSFTTESFFIDHTFFELPLACLSPFFRLCDTDN
jgi:hypothetical protein